ncbi:MAG: hypothetical protein HY784_13100 [Chloroflexi bacterium]|nr:hypothetical protein [Chloroflexota bacterium]
MIKTEVVKGLLAALHRHVVFLRSQQKYTLKELTGDLSDFDDFETHIYNYLKREGLLPNE